jgi:hypothetical protein
VDLAAFFAGLTVRDARLVLDVPDCLEAITDFLDRALALAGRDFFAVEELFFFAVFAISEISLVQTFVYVH